MIVLILFRSEIPFLGIVGPTIEICQFKLDFCTYIKYAKFDANLIIKIQSDKSFDFFSSCNELMATV